MIDRLPVTQAFQTLLATLTGRPVGLSTVPLDDNGEPVPPPYTLLDSLDKVDDDNTLADNNKAAVAAYQATFVSGPKPGHPESRGGVEQAQWMADRGWKVVQRPDDGTIGYLHALTIDGVNCWHREAREAGGTPTPEDGIITSVIRYRLFLEKADA